MTQPEKIIQAFEAIPHVISENYAELCTALRIVRRSDASVEKQGVVNGLLDIINAFDEWQQASRELSPKNIGD